MIKKKTIFIITQLYELCDDYYKLIL